MKSETVGKKPNWALRLLPVLALAAGLGLPIVAHAGSEAACDECHSYCSNQYVQQTYYCEAVYDNSDYCDPDPMTGYCTFSHLVNCYQDAAAQTQNCHEQCANGPSCS